MNTGLLNAKTDASVSKNNNENAKNAITKDNINSKDLTPIKDSLVEKALDRKKDYKIEDNYIKTIGHSKNQLSQIISKNFDKSSKKVPLVKSNNTKPTFTLNIKKCKNSILNNTHNTINPNLIKKENEHQAKDKNELEVKLKTYKDLIINMRKHVMEFRINALAEAVADKSKKISKIDTPSEKLKPIRSYVLFTILLIRHLIKEANTVV